MENFLPGSASLVDSVDKRLLVSLRDGRHLYGWLRSYDQFGKIQKYVRLDDLISWNTYISSSNVQTKHIVANLVLQDTVERIFLQDKRYAEVPHGVFLIRGENVVLLGESDQNQEQDLLSSWTKIEHAAAKQELRKDAESKQKIRLAKLKILHEKGFSDDQVHY